ncbi:hypothetical protein HQ576_09105 [bacterium]|nr:hypothetical protein [bacterium]
MDHYPGMPQPSPPREDIAAIEEQLARYRRHATPGQLAFDFAFGLVAPALLLLTDPALFTHHVAARSAFPPYAAVPGGVLAAVLGLAMLVWLATGARRQGLGIVVLGPLAVGVLASLLVAGKLLVFGIVHATLLSGLLALTPWLTLFSFVRQTLRAFRAGAGASPLLAIASLVLGPAVIVALLVGVCRSRAERAGYMEQLFLAEDAGDHRHAIDLILDSPIVDTDLFVDTYTTLPKGDRRRARIASGHFALTGEPMLEALRRLGHLATPPRPDPAATSLEDDEWSEIKEDDGRLWLEEEPYLPPDTDMPDDAEPPASPGPRTGIEPRTAPRTPPPRGSPSSPAPIPPSGTRRR